MFVLLQPTKAKLQKTDDKAIKMGQKELRSAAILNLSTVLPNTALEMFDPALRTILYAKASNESPAKGQKKMEGMDMVNDLPELTKTGQRLSTISWGEEQTGCTVTVDYGLGDAKANLTLKDATTKDFKITLNEGGAIKVGFRVHAPVDHLSDEQVGKLHRLHQRDVTIVLEGPKFDQQQEIDEEGGGDSPGGAVKRGQKVLTPEAALEQSVKKGGKK